MFEELANSEGKVVGSKQVSRALKSGELEKVYIAQDADDGLRKELIAAATAAETAYIMVPTKKQLGQLCGISVSAACAGLFKR